MSKADDKLFEDAMANLEVPPEPEAASAPLAPALEGVEIQGLEPSEAQAFDHAMSNLEVGPEHDKEDAARGPAEQRTAGGRSVKRSIRQGRVEPDVTLDLHGLTRAQAWVALERCVRASRRDGHRVLRVICGRGLHSQGPAVLLEALQEWLRGPLEEHVAESHPSAPADGGRGAWFLLLRGP